MSNVYLQIILYTKNACMHSRMCVTGNHRGLCSWNKIYDKQEKMKVELSFLYTFYRNNPKHYSTKFNSFIIISFQSPVFLLSSKHINILFSMCRLYQLHVKRVRSYKNDVWNKEMPHCKIIQGFSHW